MPSESRSQRRLFGAAEHGADFPLARKLRATMSHQQLHDFAATPEQGLPERVPHPHRNLKHYLHPKKLRGSRVASRLSTLRRDGAFSHAPRGAY